MDRLYLCVPKDLWNQAINRRSLDGSMGSRGSRGKTGSQRGLFFKSRHQGSRQFGKNYENRRSAIVLLFLDPAETISCGSILSHPFFVTILSPQHRQARS